MNEVYNKLKLPYAQFKRNEKIIEEMSFRIPDCNTQSLLTFETLKISSQEKILPFQMTPLVQQMEH